MKFDLPERKSTFDFKNLGFISIDDIVYAYALKEKEVFGIEDENIKKAAQKFIEAQAKE
jgi:hypothetical protein